MNPAIILRLLMAVMGSQGGRNILRRGLNPESLKALLKALRGARGVTVKALKPDAIKAFIGGLSANATPVVQQTVAEAAPTIQQAASEGGMGTLAKIGGMIKAHPFLTAATALPIAGMMIGRGENERRAEAQPLEGGGEGGGMQKDLKSALMLMQLAKLMQRAQDNSADMTLPAGLRVPDDAMMLM